MYKEICMRLRNGLLVLAAVAGAALYVGLDRLAPYLPERVMALAATLPGMEHISGQRPASDPAGTEGKGKADAQGAGKDGGARRQGDGGRGGGRPVIVTQAQAGALPVLRSAMGTVVPLASTALSSLTSGTVAQITVKDGAEVKAGDLLVQLDDRTVKADIQRDTATLEKNQAALDQANTTLKRVQMLTSAGAQTQQQEDDADSTARQAEAAIAVDRANLAADAVALTRTQIRAPFDGKLGVIQPSVGAVVASGGNIVTITQMKPVYAEFSLSETDLDLVRTSLSAGTLSVEISPTLSDVQTGTLSGPIVFIDNAVDAASGTVKLRALIDNADNTLWPGQALHITVHAGEKTDLAIVPAVAIQPQTEGAVAFVVGDDKIVKLRKVEVALIVGDRAGIAKGLQPGETVVTEGQAGLVDGTHVTVVAPVDGPGKQPGAGQKTSGGKPREDGQRPVAQAAPGTESALAAPLATPVAGPVAGAAAGVTP